MLDQESEISLISLKKGLFNRFISFQIIIGLMAFIGFLPFVEGYSKIIITVHSILLFTLAYASFILILLGCIIFEQKLANKIVEDIKRGRDITK